MLKKIPVAFPLLILFLAVSCGKPAAEQSTEASAGSAHADEPVTPAEAVNPIPSKTKLALLGTQCPYGSTSEHPPLDFDLWSQDVEKACPIGMNELEFITPPKMIYLGANCQKKTLSARTQERNGPDGYWETMINGEFSLEVNTVVAKLKSDGFHTAPAPTAPSTSASPAPAPAPIANGECVVPFKVDFVGNLKCLDQRQLDAKIDINVEAFYHPVEKLTEQQMRMLNLPPDTKFCKIPKGCYFYTKAVLKQCQNSF